jgi:hypothetical protein
MVESSGEPTAGSPASPKKSRVPWTRFRQWQEDRFQREKSELNDYLQAATPIALRAEEEYALWREAVAEPVQDSQKAANASATFWWRVTEGLTRFDQLSPPASARRYHRLFGDAMRNASLGGEAAKNGFRANKTYEVSRGLGFLDKFVKAMGEAEKELGQLLRKYRLA